MCEETVPGNLCKAIPGSKLNPEESNCLDEVGTFLKQINVNLPKKISAASLSHHSKLLFKAFSLRGVLVHRITDLTEVAIDLYEADKVVPAIIMTRSVFETTAVLYLLYKKIKKAAMTKMLGDIDDFLMKSLFGGRVKNAPIESYNILTAINHADKDFSSYRESYDRLSEFVHPNWSGVSGAYSKLNRSTMELYLGKEFGKVPIMISLPLLAGALELFIHYYDELDHYLLKFNKFCDQLHRK